MIKKLFIIALLFLLFALPASADEASVADEVLIYSGADKLEEVLPDEIHDQVNELTVDSAKDELNAGNIINNVLQYITGSFNNIGKDFFNIIAFLLIIGVSAVLKHSFEDIEISPVFNYVSTMCLALLSYSFIESIMNNAVTFITRACEFMTALMPVMATLFALGGKPASAVAECASIEIALTIITFIVSEALIPLVKISITLAITSAVSGIDISSVCGAVQRAATFGTLLLFTILSAIMYFQTVIAGSADSVTMRGIKFAAGSFIPVVGGLVSEASNVVSGGIGLIRGNIGLFGVVVILYLTVIPVIAIGVRKLAVSFFIFMGKIFSLDTEVKLLTDISGLLNTLSAITISVGVYFLIAMSLFIKCTAA